MKRYIDILLPGFDGRSEVAITAVHNDGSYDYKGDRCDGYGSYQPLYDESGNAVQPALTPISETERLRQQLAIQDAVLEELLFFIIPTMLQGGEL